MPPIRGRKWENQVCRGDGSMVLRVTLVAHLYHVCTMYHGYPMVPAWQRPFHASVNSHLGSGSAIPPSMGGLKTLTAMMGSD